MDKQNEVSDENKILMMLVRIGDENVEKIDMHIDKLCTYLCKQIGRLKSYITEVFLKCVFSIPNKQFIYAYILYSMANEKHEYVVDIINEVFDLFVQSINKGEDVNIVMKFIAALADTGLLSISAFENLLEQLLGLHLAAIKENNDNDYFLNLAVVGYVFGRRLIRENVDPDSKPEIELTIERYLKQRPKTTDDYYVFKSRSFESSIDQLWSAVAYSYVDGVPLEKKIYSLYLIPSDEFIIKLNCEQISTLPDISIESRFPYYKAPFCFELFADK